MKKFFSWTILFLMMITAQASAMELKINRDVDWFVSVGNREGALKIEGSNLPKGNYFNGTAIFGDRLYLHFDSTIATDNFDEMSKFGGRDINNTVPLYAFEGSTRIYPVNGGGHEFFLLVTETGGGGCSNLIGERGGKWVQYFDTCTTRRQHGIGLEYMLTNFTTEGDTLVFTYQHWQTKKTYELRYKWDEAAQWFGVDVRG